MRPLLITVALLIASNVFINIHRLGNVPMSAARGIGTEYPAPP
jgi:hypothetical protein